MLMSLTCLVDPALYSTSRCVTQLWAQEVPLDGTDLREQGSGTWHPCVHSRASDSRETDLGSPWSCTGAHHSTHPAASERCISLMLKVKDLMSK